MVSVSPSGVAVGGRAEGAVWNVGCALLSGGFVSAVWYTRDVCGVWCQRSIHAAPVASSVFSF